MNNNRLVKIITLILSCSLSLIGITNAWLVDVEVSLGNSLAAATLDFSLSSDELFTPDILSPGDLTTRNIAIIKNGSLDFQYSGQVAKTGGDDDFCEILQLEAKKSGLIEYAGGLLAFNFNPALEIEPDGQDNWQMTVSFSDDNPDLQGRNCQFNFVFTGWQTDSDGSWGFTDEETLESNSIFSGWWADNTPPESEITGLDFSYTTLNFEIGYFAEDPNTSGVKEVNLYYSHTFDEGEWKLFGSDTPDIGGNGSFAFTSPLGDGVYEFKTEAEDYAGNKEEKLLADASTQVDTQKPITMLSLGEFDSKRFAYREILANGNFEDSHNPSSGWTFGGSGDHQAVDDLAIVRGSNSFLIGFKNTDPATLSDLPAQDFLFQDIDLPVIGTPTLSFWYRLNSEDILDYDWFQALVLNPLDGSILAYLAHGGLDLFRGTLSDLGWKEVTHSLTDFLGQTVRLYFEVVNSGDKNFKTWVYLDDIRTTEGENYLDPTAEISLETSDASGLGVLTTEYKIDDGPWKEYISPFTLDEGEHELAYRSEDVGGLVEEEKTIPLVSFPSAGFVGIVLNQISPRPSGLDRGSSGIPLDGEWIELWNNSALLVNLNDWVLYDADNHVLTISVFNSDNNGDTNDAGETIIPVGGFLRVYRNGDGDFSLNDSGDRVEFYNDYKTRGGFLIDSFVYGATEIDDKTWKRIPDGTGTWADPEEKPKETFEVDFDFREDKKAVWFKVSKIASLDLLKYEIVYDSSEGERGIVGEIEINGREEIERRDLMLGTCSGIEGKVCVYDQGVSKVQLKINLVSKDDEEEEIKKEIFP